VSKRWTWVAWSMLAVFVVSLVLAAILAVANNTLDAVSFAGLSLGFAAFMVVGALIVAHQPRNAMGWTFSAIALLAFTGELAAEYAIRCSNVRRNSDNRAE
jgi:phosphotransferase system  glucose/maltose/N-acetylglucosamine-specific IIC component